MHREADQNEIQRKVLVPGCGIAADVDRFYLLGDAMNWQPIETAPRDGTTVIAYRPTKPPHIEGMYFIDGYWHWAYDGNAPATKPPTHWMQLPPPPVDT